MILPFKGSFVLTQKFGENPANYSQFGLLGHNGLDYGLPTGTQVTAPHNGKVIETASDPTGYGNYIKIENDIEGSVLAHLKEFRVKVGDSVSEGQLIGISNNTGNSTGPHLHWGYYRFPRDRTNGYAGFINQLPLIGTPIPPQTGGNMNEGQAAVEFDRVLQYLKSVSIITDDAREKNLGDHQTANAIKAYHDNMEKQVQDLTNQLNANPGASQKLTEAKRLAGEIIKL